MSTLSRYMIGTFFQLILILLGIWAIHLGKFGLGSGLIAATLMVFIVRSIKTKKIKEQQDKGLNPYDERAYYITGKAAYASYRIFIIISASFVLFGSILGPKIKLDPYNLIGMVILVMVLLHIIFYYYYSSRE